MNDDAKWRVGFFLAFWLLSFAGLALLFSISDRLRYFTYSPSEVIAGYVELALAVAVCGGFVAPALALRFELGHLGRFIIAASTSFLMISALAFVIGTLPGPIADRIPAIHGPFFSEWKFITFIAEFSTSISVVSGLGVVLLARMRQKPEKTT